VTSLLRVGYDLTLDGRIRGVRATRPEATVEHVIDAVEGRIGLKKVPCIARGATRWRIVREIADLRSEGGHVKSTPGIDACGEGVADARIEGPLIRRATVRRANVAAAGGDIPGLRPAEAKDAAWSLVVHRRLIDLAFLEDSNANACCTVVALVAIPATTPTLHTTRSREDLVQLRDVDNRALSRCDGRN